MGHRRLATAPRLGWAFLALALGIAAPAARAQPAPCAEAARTPEEITTVATVLDFETLLRRVEAAATGSGMVVVTRASASEGAAKRGVRISGDAVLGVFRNDFAVRMLAANPAAGIEAPIPLHVFETQDGRASVAYRAPSVVFGRYGGGEIAALGTELDEVFRRIVRVATTD